MAVIIPHQRTCTYVNRFTISRIIFGGWGRRGADNKKVSSNALLFDKRPETLNTVVKTFFKKISFELDCLCCLVRHFYCHLKSVECAKKTNSCRASLIPCDLPI